MTDEREPTIHVRGDDFTADSWVRSLRFLPWVSAVLYTIIGIRYLYLAHPSEDAFILFKYVENFVQGFGIVYYPGGPHAEGATDFLWFLLLSGMRFLGMDVAVAACLLGAVGAGLATHLFCELVRRSGARGPGAFAFGCLSLCILYYNATLSGYFGFSAMLYSAVFLALACLVWWADRGIVWVPFLALALALIRPDGVVPAILFAALGWMRAREMRVALRYTAWSALALGLGAAYYAWRLDYFGLLLPLPLYVKSRQTPLLTPVQILWSTIRIPIAWIWNEPALKAMSLGALLLLAFRVSRPTKSALRTVLVFSPFLVHSVIMGYATQMQNVVGRFQAPERLAVLFVLVGCGLRAWQSRPQTLARAFAFTACAAPIGYEMYWGLRVMHNYEYARYYVDSFAPEFGRLMGPNRVIALTEAGRLCYWTHARVEDTIGLNTSRTALAPPDQKYFEEISPDVLMFHAGPTNLKNALRDRVESVVQIPSELLGQCMRPEYMWIYRDGISTYEKSTPDTVAVILMARFLEKSQAYDVYAVRYGPWFNHVYAIKKGLPEGPRIVELLKETTSGSGRYSSYADVQHFWFTDNATP